MKNILYVLLFLLLCNCSNQKYKDSYRNDIKQWIGKSESDVIKAFGLPINEKIIDHDIKIIEEEQKFGILVNLTFGSFHGFNNYCKQSFIIDLKTNKVIDISLIIAEPLYERCRDLLPYFVNK